MGQVELANVPIKGWSIDPDVHGLLGGFSGVVHIPTHYGEIVHTDALPRDVTMVIGGGRGLEMFFHFPLADSPMYPSSQSVWSHLYLQITPLF